MFMRHYLKLVPVVPQCGLTYPAFFLVVGACVYNLLPSPPVPSWNHHIIQVSSSELCCQREKSLPPLSSLNYTPPPLLFPSTSSSSPRPMLLKQTCVRGHLAKNRAFSSINHWPAWLCCSSAMCCHVHVCVEPRCQLWTLRGQIFILTHTHRHR